MPLHNLSINYNEHQEYIILHVLTDKLQLLHDKVVSMFNNSINVGSK